VGGAGWFRHGSIKTLGVVYNIALNDDPKGVLTVRAFDNFHDATV
jgi:hypothetical protein